MRGACALRQPTDTSITAGTAAAVASSLNSLRLRESLSNIARR